MRVLKEIITHNARGLQPIYSELGTLEIINSRHILETDLDYKNFEKTEAENWTIQSKARVLKNDILTYTTGANIGRTQVYLSDRKALASNHVNILRIKTENPIYVAFVINSIIGRLQTDKLSAGSAQQELYPKDLEQFFIPFVKEATQIKICTCVEEGREAKKQAERLLSIAKGAVESAIETSEDKAVAWLNEQL